MNKFDYIFNDADKVLALAEDLEQVLNKHELTLITFVNGQDDYDGNIVAFFDIQEP